MNVYYPPGSVPPGLPQSAYCNAPDLSEYGRYHQRRCHLLADHDGNHDFDANWNARVEVEQRSSAVQVAFRSWHDTRSLYVRDRAEADALLTFLAQQFDQAFNSNKARGIMRAEKAEASIASRLANEPA